MREDELASFRNEMRKIACDEGGHCIMLVERLQELGVKFGDFPVISNLTNTVFRT